MSTVNDAGTTQFPARLLQQLIQFDTTNPPGNESDCISFIRGLLSDAGIESTILAKTPERPNLVARLPGQGNVPPLLMYGHVDVVTTEDQIWQYPPFEGKLADGFLWGRGALDMKGGVAMMLSAMLRAKAADLPLPGDVVLAIVSDEEANGDYGARFLVEQHPDLFQGIRYALGEFGGFTLHLGQQRFYPIMIAEKQICWLKVTLRGPGGHGSMPIQGGAMRKLSTVLRKIDRQRLPVHVTPIANQMFTELADSLGGLTRLVLRQLTKPLLTNSILNLLGDRSRIFDPLLHNTVSPTILHGSSKINVIPNAVSVELDGRLLPGFHPNDLIKELHQILGNEVEIEVVRYDPGPTEPDMGLYKVLADIIHDADPEGVPIPFMLSGVTDGRYFSQLGIQTYGFTPMQLPEDFNFTQTIHAADERIPIDAVDFGTQAIYQVLTRFHA
jgi:acetylornithine deacetylase/succinyl-diaminopimelate desuccinylase-like protein